MRTLEKKLQFITPAFLAGANQNTPEVRPASIRGALRWWFRVLGGTREDERELFGDVHGDVIASKIVVRVENVRKSAAALPPHDPGIPMGYLMYFAKVSGNKEGIHRTDAGHYLGEGTTFTLRILERYPVEKEALWAKLEATLDAFVHYGTLGLRATRGFGMLAEQEPPTPPPVALPNCFLAVGEACNTALDAHKRLSDDLKALRREVSKESAIGSSSPRVASALRLLILPEAGRYLPALFYTDHACSAASIKGEIATYAKDHGYTLRHND